MATVEVEAPASGILANVAANPGDEVPVGRRIAVILAPGESHSKESVEARAASSAPAAAPPAAPQRPSAEMAPSLSPAGRALASPAAKRIAQEKGIDLSELKGSGPEGSIVAEDVLKAAEPKSPRIMPLTAMRRIIGSRMTKSKQEAPHFYVSMDVEMSEVNRKRTQWKQQAKSVVPSINDFILWASARALKDFPALNSTFTEQGVRLIAEINIGMAVAVEDGLVVPVIRNADRLSLEELAAQSRELAEKAQRKKLFPLDYEGGTFTVSNLGMFGVDTFVAIINPPQCAILAVGQVAQRAVARGNEIVARPIMTMTLSADHRIADGVLAARFLQEVKELLERAEDR
jgi:pyruvate dehydrogenase E2 component (dihydrolipoamide acetyltransferase)